MNVFINVIFLQALFLTYKRIRRLHSAFGVKLVLWIKGLAFFQMHI